MTLMQKKATLIGAGIVILVATFFLLFQRNQETVSELEAETRTFQNKVNYLSTLQMSVNEMSETAPQKQEATDSFAAEFPCKVPQQKAIYNLYMMMKKSGIRITAVTPGDPQTFFQGEQFILSESTETVAASGSLAEENPESKVELHEMVGKVSIYEIQLSGSLNKIMKAIDWVGENKERMSVTDLNLSYDSSTGLLNGSMVLNFYEMNGNGKAYEEPDVSSINIGTGSISKVFGTIKK